jgi:hypothetical protein
MFTEKEEKQQCNKDYSSCIYSAQGTIMCNVQKAMNVPEPKVIEGFSQALEYTPGMSLGGLPNFAPLPNRKAFEQ